MPEKEPAKKQQKPSKSRRGGKGKPDYSKVPFATKLLLADTGVEFFHPAVPRALFTMAGYDKPLPPVVERWGRFANLHELDDGALHLQYAEHMVWLQSLGPDTEPTHPDDLCLLYTYADCINHLGRLPSLGEIVAARKDEEPHKTSEGLAKTIKPTLQKKMRLPYVDDDDLDAFKEKVAEDPGVLDDAERFWTLATETAPIYTPLEQWPPDLICHLLVGADLAGFDDDSKPLLRRWGLPEYLSDLQNAGVERVTEEFDKHQKGWRELPTESRLAVRDALTEGGRRYVVGALPWVEEGEQLRDFTYVDGDEGIPWVLSENAFNWESSSASSIFDHLDLPLVATILEALEARNLRLLSKWAKSSFGEGEEGSGI